MKVLIAESGRTNIIINKEEAAIIGWGVQYLGENNELHHDVLCNRCNKDISGDIIYIPVLSDCYCAECNEKLEEHLPYYEEDAMYESRKSASILKSMLTLGIIQERAEKKSKKKALSAFSYAKKDMGANFSIEIDEFVRNEGLGNPGIKR